MNEESLEKMVSKDQLKEKGFRCKPHYMYKIHGDYEIRYVEVIPNGYILDGVGRIPPKMKSDHLARAEQLYEGEAFIQDQEPSTTPTEEWKREIDSRFDKLK